MLVDIRRQTKLRMLTPGFTTLESCRLAKTRPRSNGKLMEPRSRPTSGVVDIFTKALPWVSFEEHRKLIMECETSDYVTIYSCTTPGDG